MIKRLFQASSTVASAAFIVGLFSLLSRMAGLIRERVLLSIFDAGSLDVYYQAFRLPDLLFQLFVVGAISASFIPIFTNAYKDEQKERAWRYTNNVLHAVILIFGLISVVAIILAPELSATLAHGFPPEKQMAVARMTRIIFAGQLFFAASMVFGSVLQGAKRFFLPSFAPIVYNAGIIAGAIFFAPTMGLAGLAWGVVLGSFLHALVQAVGAYGLGYRYAPYLKLRDPDLVHTLKQTVPRLMGLAVNQVSFVIMSSIATGLAIGSVRDLNLAYNLNFFPIGIVAVSYAIAAYPTFCERVAHKDMPGLRASFSLAIRQVIFFMIPATILFLILRAQIVRVTYGTDNFDWDATRYVANALGLFAISFFAQASNYILVRMFYALDDTKTPFFLSLLSAAINIGLGVFLAPMYGVLGLAIAYSASEMFKMAALWALLRIKTGGLDEGKILKSLMILSLAGFISGIAGQQAKSAVVSFTGNLDTFVEVFAQLITVSVLSLILYVIISYILKSPEVRSILSGLQAKFLKSAAPTEVGDVGQV